MIKINYTILHHIYYIYNIYTEYYVEIDYCYHISDGILSLPSVRYKNVAIINNNTPGD